MNGVEYVDEVYGGGGGTTTKVSWVEECWAMVQW